MFTCVNLRDWDERLFSDVEWMEVDQQEQEVLMSTPQRAGIPQRQQQVTNTEHLILHIGQEKEEEETRYLPVQ